MHTKKSVGLSFVMGTVLAGCISLNCQAAERDASLYVGTKSCAMCHKKEETGNQFAKWQASPHAKAYEVLGTAEAKAAGAKVGVADPQKSGKCLKCHATAYNFTEELQVKAADGETAKVVVEDAVTCESCHGPGKNYKSKSVMEDQKKAIEAGMIFPSTKGCALCHNDQSPSWKADRYTTKDGKKVGFDPEQAYEKIKHPKPAAAK